MDDATAWAESNYLADQRDYERDCCQNCDEDCECESENNLLDSTFHVIIHVKFLPIQIFYQIRCDPGIHLRRSSHQLQLCSPCLLRFSAIVNASVRSILHGTKDHDPRRVNQHVSLSDA